MRYQKFTVVAFHESVLIQLNPVALRKAKIVFNFALPECNKVKVYKVYQAFLEAIVQVFFRLHRCICLFGYLKFINTISRFIPVCLWS